MGRDSKVWWREVESVAVGMGVFGVGLEEEAGGERQRAANDEDGGEAVRGGIRGVTTRRDLARRRAGCVAALVLGCLVSGGAAQQEVPRAIEAPTPYQFNFGRTLATLGGTPLDGSIFPIKCKNEWWPPYLTGYYSAGAKQVCPGGGSAPACVATHKQCRDSCVDSDACTGYYLPRINNFGGTCRDQDPTDVSGTCKCFHYGEDAVLQDITNFGSLDNSPKLNDVDMWSTYVKRRVSCPGTQAYPITVINTRPTIVFVAAVSNSTSDVAFSYSPAMARNIDSKKVQILPFDTITEGGTRYRIFSMHIPEFVPAAGMGMCVHLAPSIPETCVKFAPQVAPDAMMVVGNRALGSASDGLLRSTSPMQVPVSGTLYITVRAHDLNYEDRVTISVKKAVSPNFPARQIAVSDSYWSNLKWLGDTHCPRISKDGKICEDGWWERTAVYVPRVDDSSIHNVTFTASDDGDRFSPPVGYIKYNGTKGWSTQNYSLGIQVMTNMPAFIDDARDKGGLSDAAPKGTPRAESHLPTAYVNCPMADVGVYAHYNDLPLTLSWSTPLPELPEGMNFGGFGTWEYRIPTINGGLENKANAVIGAIKWTPKEHEAGRSYRICVRASAVGRSEFNDRCWRIKVALCQYCVQGSTSLASVALKFKTTWLQLWAVNNQPILEEDGGVDPRRWLSPTDPDTFVSGDQRLIVVGPVYRFKQSDSLAGIATRFHTTVEEITKVNPSIQDPRLLQPGQEICVIPDICPK